MAFFIFALPEGVRSAAALLALAASSGLAAWQLMRARKALGGVHPGLRWYVAALGCLIASLLAVLAMSVWPQQMLALKRLHLHLNLFGFVGLTAIGTMQVLLPTAAGRPDPQVGNRLRADLPAALGGTVLIALGAAWLPLLSWLGLLLWMVPLARLLRAWLARYRAEIFRRHGAVPLLATALAGYSFSLVAGGLHGAGWLDATGVAHLFVFSFLFPLVSGAAGQLLPLWLKPGQQTGWHGRARLRLTYAAGLRATLLMGAGLLVLAGFQWATGLRSPPCCPSPRLRSACCGRDGNLAEAAYSAQALALGNLCVDPAIDATRRDDVQPQPQVGCAEQQRGGIGKAAGKNTAASSAHRAAKCSHICRLVRDSGRISLTLGTLGPSRRAGFASGTTPGTARSCRACR